MFTNQMRITGFASGLDTTSMIRDLMTAERAPLDKLFQQKEWLQWQRDAYRDVNLEIATFRNKADKLRFSSGFNGFSASSSDTSRALVAAQSNAVAGSYNLTINSLAEVAKIKTVNAIIKSDGTAAQATDKILAAGQTASFTIESLNGQASITITEDDTYSSLASKISSATDATTGISLGVRASFDATTSRFVLSSKEMGGNQKIVLTDTSAAGSTNVAGLITNGGSAAQSSGTATVAANVTGTYGEIVFDGTLIQNLKSNKVSVYGVDLTLLKADPVNTTTISVNSDTESIFANIKDFVESYNSLIDSFNTKIKEPKDRDYRPLTDAQREELSEKEAEKWDEKAKQGLLYNDQILRETLTKLRGSMYTPVAGIPNGQLRMLSELGIKSPYMSLDGKLEIDEAKLREAIANKPDEIEALFTSEDGIASRVYEEVNKAIDKLNKKAGGPQTSPNLDSSALGKSIAGIGQQMISWEDKLARIEERYWKQFTAMETALSKMNEQSNYITGMIG
ncbi:flagellar cap protein [Bacillus canaveralius]|uniref:Flagellar hook-associated protein 2 n=1 Tax=Bacillus canaveralius TaxID=1403243 RepID=A0A2N5GMN9_9BACI|nr:flagellar filament capping protein FliD [Bacillus canaveralius]PLR83169.1 flagellar cap protein [Bacillus canaveralius]PLR94087.1 flagellar cap protein [Bacillus canaveralius]RSK54113.1 flagellar cap protein [Bacillus canaveralius]